MLLPPARKPLVTAKNAPRPKEPAITSGPPIAGLRVGNFTFVHVGLYTVGGFLTAAMIVGADQLIKFFR